MTKAVILGNGPSLNEIDFDYLNSRKDVITLASNRISLIFNKTDWRPNYYFCFSTNIENKVWLDNVNEVIDNDKTTCFLSSELKPILGDKKNIIFIDNIYEHNRHSSIPYNLFEKNFTDVVVKSYSATVPMFQYCFSNGIKKIGIIGQDGYIYSNNKNHFDDSYGYESGDFKKTNDRIISI